MPPRMHVAPLQDFKPHNILLASPLRPGQPDVVKLVDFGLSKDEGLPIANSLLFTIVTRT